MKMKWLKRIVALMCAGAMVCGTLAGCGKQGGDKPTVDNTVEDKTNLKIMLFAQGYGTAWVEAMADAFEAKNEGVKVDIKLAQSGEVMKADLKNYKYCDTDLYLDIVNGSGHSLMAEMSKAYDGKQAMRDLTYLFNSQIPGEEVTLGEKMNTSLKDACVVDGRDTEDTKDDTFYYLPYVTATMGLYYNETVIDNALGKGNWKLPNTSDELIALCEQLKAKGCAFLLPGGLDQWAGSYYLAWWAQYEGMENFLKFFDGIGYDSTKNRETTNSNLIFKQPGREAAAIASHNLLGYDKGYTLKNSIEINVYNLNEYQTRFTLAKNNYAFYPCGDWLMQELENNSTIKSDSVIKLMKTPVISSIIESTNSYSKEKAKRLPNVTSDAVLSQVVDYVDGKGSLPAGVTEEEAAVVKEARNITGSMATNLVMYAPSFSNAKTLADEFMLFMASDEGIQILKDNCKGGFSPFNYEYTNLNATEQSVYEATKEAIYVDNFFFNPLFYSAGVAALSAGTADTLDGLFCKPNGPTGEEINKMMIEAFEGKKWDNYLTKLSE